MYTEAIKDFSGKILYYLEHKDNGDIVRKSFSGQIEETYSAKRNITQNFSGKILTHGNALGGKSTQNIPSQPYPKRKEDIKDFGGKILYTLEHKPNGDIVKKSFSGRIEGTYNASRNVTQDFSGKILAQGNILGGTSQKSQATPDSNTTYQPTRSNYASHGTEIEMLRPQNAIEAIFAITGPFYIMFKMLYWIITTVCKGITAIYDKNHYAFPKKNMFKITSGPAQSKIGKPVMVLLIMVVSVIVLLLIASLIFK